MYRWVFMDAESGKGRIEVMMRISFASHISVQLGTPMDKD